MSVHREKVTAALLRMWRTANEPWELSRQLLPHVRAGCPRSNPAGREAFLAWCRATGVAG